MSGAVIKKQDGGADFFAPQGFDPKQIIDSEPEWLGQRREIECASEALPWRWPEDRVAQYKAFDDWHDIAMQIVHRANTGFRLMAVYKKVIRWKEGCIWASDHELAEIAGRCVWKTISREVATHKKLGIIIAEHGWRVVGGKKVRTRAIRPAVPSIIDPEIEVRDLPNHTDTRGPITIDTIEEGASSNVTA